MVKNAFIVAFFFLFSCSNGSDKPEFVLKSIETIEYVEDDSNLLIELHEEQLFENGRLLMNTKSIVKKRFDEKKNLLEEITYTIEGHDSLKWSHRISKYDGQGNLIRSADSVNGTLRNQVEREYEGSVLKKELSILINPQMDFSGEDLVYTSVIDSSFSISYHHYNADYRNIYSRIVSWDNSLSKLEEEFSPDTSFMYYTYDTLDKVSQVIGISNEDTTFAESLTYDANGNLETSISIGLADLSGPAKHVKKYDHAGLLKTELHESPFGLERIDYQYDSKSRIVEIRAYSTH